MFLFSFTVDITSSRAGVLVCGATSQSLGTQLWISVLTDSEYYHSYCLTLSFWFLFVCLFVFFL